MAELIEREMTDGNGVPLIPGRAKIPIHLLQAVMAEWARSKITNVQALDALEAAAPPRLNAAEIAEAQNIVNLVTSIAVAAAPAALGNNPTANALRDYALAWGQRDEALAQRSLKIKEIEDVFYAMEQRAPLYSTPTEVRAKLGIV